MASLQNFLRPEHSRLESPAKVFAKLKSKVRKETLFAAEEEGGGVRGREPPPSRRAAEPLWRRAEQKENQNQNQNQNHLAGSEARPLILSPMKSPQRGCPRWAAPHQGDPLTSLKLHTPTKRPLMESTAVFHSHAGDRLPSMKLHTPTKRPLMESTAVFHSHAGDPLPSMKLHTPTKRPLMESTAVFHSHAGDPGGFTRRTPAKRRPGPAESSWSPEREEEPEAPGPPGNIFSPSRKRKVDLQGRKGVDSSKKGHRTKVEEEACGQPGEDPSREAVGRGFSLPAEAPYEAPYAQHRSTARTRECAVSLMSPAKMFALMKGRESRREQRGAHRVGSNTRRLCGDGGAAPLSSPGEMEDDVFTSESPPPPSRPETADSQSDASPPPVLLEDPVVLDTPRVSIPKKKSSLGREAAQREDGVIYLKKWLLRKNHRGFYVDGLRKEDNAPWNSNLIVERVSSTVLKTLSGRVYILVGKMKVDVASDFPSWLLKRFANGFPSNWKELYEKFRSEGSSRKKSRESRTSSGRGRSTKAADASSLKAAVKPQPQAFFKTPESCPPASSTKVSRSGRVIKPPLEYWKGGRVILDADMNVTIFECYDTSICRPQEVSPGSKPAKVFLPCSKEKDLYSCSAPERRVKAPARRPKRDKVRLDEEPPPPPPAESSRHRRLQEGERTVTAREEAELHGDPERPQTRRSKRILGEKSPDEEHPPPRAPRPRRTATPPAPAHNDDTSSDEEFSIKRRKPSRAAPGRRGGGRRSATTPSSEEGEQGPGKTLKVKKVKKVAKPITRTKMAPPTDPAPKMAELCKKPTGSRKHPPSPQQDDEWTAAELDRLQQAVSSYPKHVAGYWAKVARMVGARSAEECHHQHTAHRRSATPTKKTRTAKRDQREPVKETENALISARAGTLRRKQQVRHFLETMPKEDVDDVFSSAYMQDKRFEMPSMCPSEEHDFALSELEPVTPVSTGFPEVKTPQCLHITPGMLGSPSSTNDDKYVYQLQKRMKKKQFSVHKQAPASKSFTPSPSLRRTMKRCGTTENDTFVVWQMFPEKAEVTSDSEDEEDFYFTNDD